MKRKEWVDKAKGIGVLLVVFGHVDSGLYHAGIEMPRDLHGLVKSVIYAFHMPLFFLLSGLFFSSSRKRRGSAGIVWSKVDTLVYPFLVWTLLQGSLQTALSRWTNGTFSVGDFVSVAWGPKMQLWYLYSLFLMFAISAATYSLFKARAGLALLGIALCGYVFSKQIPEIFLLRRTAEYFIYFVSGILLMGRVHLPVRGSYVALGIAIALLSQGAFHYLGFHYTDRGLFALLVAASCIFFIVIFCQRVSGRTSDVLGYLGRYSMDIYIMHFIAGAGGRIVMQHMKMLGIDNYWLHLTVGMSLGIAGPLVAMVVMERLRIRYLFSAPISTGVLGGWSRVAARLST